MLTWLLVGAGGFLLGCGIGAAWILFRFGKGFMR